MLHPLRIRLIGRQTEIVEAPRYVYLQLLQIGRFLASLLIDRWPHSFLDPRYREDSWRLVRLPIATEPAVTVKIRFAARALERLSLYDPLKAMESLRVRIPFELEKPDTRKYAAQSKKKKKKPRAGHCQPPHRLSQAALYTANFA